MLITEKIEKIKKTSKDFFQSLRQPFLKFYYPEAISKQLTVLIESLNNWKSLKNKK